jgi:hypothetical protein
MELASSQEGSTMSNLDPRIEAVRKEYNLDRSDFWQIPQNKQWVCKHAALEVVATKAGVEWGTPQIIEADAASGIASMIVTGKLADRSEWATGEASPKNNKNSYPWAMAEKRAKDRVILKLVGIHGLVYSEDELDQTRNDNTPHARKSSAQLKREDQWTALTERAHQDMLDIKGVVGLNTLWKDYIAEANDNGWTVGWKDALADIFAAKKVEILAQQDETGEAA